MAGPHTLECSLRTLALVPDYVTPEVEAQLLSEIHASRQAWRSVSGRRLQSWGGAIARRGLANHVLVNSYQPGDGIMPHEDGPLYYPAVAILSLGAPAVLRFARKRQPDACAADAGPAAVAAASVPAAVGAAAPQQRTDARSRAAAEPAAQARSSAPTAAEAPAAGGPPAPPAPGGAARQEGGRPAAPLADLEASVICPPRSLLIFKNDAYTSCLHGVMEVAEEPIDASVVNAEACGLARGARLARGGERVSLTVRRVLRTYAGLGVRR
eukprot:scaffold16.g57.t1